MPQTPRPTLRRPTSLPLGPGRVHPALRAWVCLLLGWWLLLLGADPTPRFLGLRCEADAAGATDDEHLAGPRESYVSPVSVHESGGKPRAVVAAMAAPSLPSAETHPGEGCVAATLAPDAHAAGAPAVLRPLRC